MVSEFLNNSNQKLLENSSILEFSTTSRGPSMYNVVSKTAISDPSPSMEKDKKYIYYLLTFLEVYEIPLTTWQ